MRFLSLAASLSLLLTISAFAKEAPLEKKLSRENFVSSLIKEGDVCAEIGVYQGLFAYNVLLRCNPSKLYLIDPWLADLQTNLDTIISQEQQYWNKIYSKVCAAFDPYNNVEIIRQKSEDTASNFPNEYFDFVYIDGEHSYEAVLRDLTNYFPKIKIGGYIVGDAYGYADVADAVQEFITFNEDELLWGDDPFLGKNGGQYLIQRIK